MSYRMSNGQIANVDPETGIHYGVISTHSLDEFALDAIYTYGEDLTYLEAYAEEEKELRRKYFGRNAHLAEQKLEEWNDAYYCDESTYRYETEENGETIVVQTTGDSYLWVFKGPVVRARACSPCYPNAGNLDELENGYLDTYGLPAAWLRKEGE